MTRQARSAIVAVVALCLFAGGYVWFASVRTETDLAARNEAAQQRLESFGEEIDVALTADFERPPAQLPFVTGSSFLETGDLVYISRVPGPDYGRLGILSADGQRQLLDRTCGRVHVSGSLGICVDGPDVFNHYAVYFLDFSTPEVGVTKEESGVLPSRARVAADQTYASATMFASGTSYSDIGGFSTYVTMTDLTGVEPTLLLSRFDIEVVEERHTIEEPQFWGVSFADDGDFWVTGRFDGFTELLQGSAAERTLTPTGIEGSCPSLSPDGSTLVFKELQADGSSYSLVARDLDTGEQWTLGEDRSVDDQVEWRDDDTILYALVTTAPDVAQPEWDLWELDIAPGSTPRLLLPNADSPVAIR